MGQEMVEGRIRGEGLKEKWEKSLREKDKV